MVYGKLRVERKYNKKGKAAALSLNEFKCRTGSYQKVSLSFRGSLLQGSPLDDREI